MERLQIHPSESPNRDTEPKSLEIIRRTVGGCGECKDTGDMQECPSGFSKIPYTVGQGDFGTAWSMGTRSHSVVCSEKCSDLGSTSECSSMLCCQSPS
jgi:hypothetical protein